MKATVASLTEIPEALRPEYVEKDGKFVLRIEGDVPGLVPGQALAEANGRIVEFRDNNVKLLKAIGAESVDGALAKAAIVASVDAEKLKRLMAIDPAEHEALKAKAAGLKDKGVDTAEDVDKKVSTALETYLKPIKDELAAERAARAEDQKRIDSSAVRSAISDRFIKIGKPDALDFIASEFAKDFRVVAGQVKAREELFSPEKPGQPMTPDEWLAAKTKMWGFAFHESRGGGAGAPQTPGNGAARPGSVVIKNPTPQELGRLHVKTGVGLVDAQERPVVIEMD